ncbi:MAG TPA: PEGA domain-containing protein, partial [bacterium]|nr:PEGA domain-containing protein [bacterium]
FSALTGSVREDKLASYEQRILELVDQLRFLEELDPREIVFPESKPVHFNIGGESGSLFPAPVFSPLRMAKREKLDLLIWGRIEEVQDYLYIELGALDTALGREVFSFKDAAAREDLHESIDAIVEELVPVVWGRDWSSLLIEVQPRDSRVYLDGEYIAEGDVFLEYLLPGRREVHVVRAGYMESMAEVELVPYETTKYRVHLLEKVPEMVWIDSNPGEVNVYQGAMWLGKTPLEIIRPESTTRLLLRSEESDDFSFHLDKNSPSNLSFSLPGNLDPESLQKKRRNDFYASFGLFAISVPLPIYFFNLTNDYALSTINAANARDEAEAQGLSAEAQSLNAEVQRFYAGYNNYTTAYLGTLAVSVSLFVNAVITLLRYIASADRM